MSKTAIKPIYHQGRDQYTIDSCIPQKMAIKKKKFQLFGITRGHYPGKAIPKKYLPGLCSLGYWNAIGQQDWGLEPHRNEGIELVFLETGQMPMLLEDVQQNLLPGQFTITRPWQRHCHGYPHVGPGRLHWLIIDVGVRRPNDSWKWPAWIQLTTEDIKDLTQLLSKSDLPCWRGTEVMKQTFKALAYHLHHPEPIRRISHITIAVNQLLIEVLDSLRKIPVANVESISSNLQTVELFLKDLTINHSSAASEWSLQSMARHCGMGITAFVDHCNQITNTSPMNFLNTCRLDHAAKDLKSYPDKNIIQVAMDSGFSTSQYFATQFKKRFGHSPRASRRKN